MLCYSEALLNNYHALWTVAALTCLDEFTMRTYYSTVIENLPKIYGKCLHCIVSHRYTCQQGIDFLLTA